MVEGGLTLHFNHFQINALLYEGSLLLHILLQKLVLICTIGLSAPSLIGCIHIGAIRVLLMAKLVQSGNNTP